MPRAEVNVGNEKSELRVAIWEGVGLLCSKKFVPLCTSTSVLEYRIPSFPLAWLLRLQTVDFYPGPTHVGAASLFRHVRVNHCIAAHIFSLKLLSQS